MAGCEKECELVRSQLLEDSGVASDVISDLLEVLSESFDERCRNTQSLNPQDVCKQSLLEWGHTYLKDYFTKLPSTMHEWLASQLDELDRRRGAKINLVGPRGGAKSTIGTLAYVLRCAVKGTEPYIWIVSDTLQQAQSHLRNIRDELVDNAALAAAHPFSVGPGPVWRASTVVLRNGTMIEALGTGQRIRGRRRRSHRPTLIVCDDLQNDDHMRSAHLRLQTQRWFEGALMKAGTKTTNVVNLATALHRDALAMRLCKTPGWNSKRFCAVVQWPTSTEHWRHWEELYCDVENPTSQVLAQEYYEEHRSSMDEGAEVLWPDEEDLYTLMCMRVESGRTAFEREKQSSPSDPDSCEWPEEYFGVDIWFDHWPEQIVIKTIALDPSKGADARHGDYSALVALGIDSNGVIYVEGDLARRPIPQMVSDAVALADRFRPHVFGIESNQFQELLADIVSDEFQRQGVAGIPIASINNTVNKRVRIRRLGPLLSMKRLRFKSNSPSTQLVVDQLRDFPTADHDDGPDAIEMAFRLAEEMLSN